MLKFLNGPDNALAVSFSGVISGDNLSQVLTRLEQQLRVFRVVDVYVETHEITGIQVFALPSYAARALPLFGQLRSFGRVAIVANQAWIRLGSRVESALLPGISYRVFEPARRDEARAWAFHLDESSV
jgi:hypothetical protein